MPDAPTSPSPGDDGPDSLATFDTGPEPTEPEPEAEREPTLSKRQGTTLGFALAVVVSTVTVLVARSLLEDAGVPVGIGETVAVGLVAFLVASAGFLPLRWGLWVVPFVTFAHYGLNLWNMIFSEGSVYEFVQGDAMGYAVLTPGIGVVLGWILEGVYRFVAPE